MAHNRPNMRTVSLPVVQASIPATGFQFKQFHNFSRGQFPVVNDYLIDFTGEVLPNEYVADIFGEVQWAGASCIAACRRIQASVEVYFVISVVFNGDDMVPFFC
jgi:hypothetical protein